MTWTIAAFLSLVASDLQVGTNALKAAINATPEVAGLGVGQRYTLRSVTCVPIDEEPSEHRCEFEMRISDGPWQAKTAIIAYDDGWVLLDWEVDE